MKVITLDKVIQEQQKDPSFVVEYERELLVNAIAQMLVALRKSKQLTQTQLAKKVGTTQSVIARLESGRDTRIPSLDMLARIANATHTKLNVGFELR